MFNILIISRIISGQGKNVTCTPGVPSYYSYTSTRYKEPVICVNILEWTLEGLFLCSSVMRRHCETIIGLRKKSNNNLQKKTTALQICTFLSLRLQSFLLSENLTTQHCKCSSFKRLLHPQLPPSHLLPYPPSPPPFLLTLSKEVLKVLPLFPFPGHSFRQLLQTFL